MPQIVRLEHFRRAVDDISAHGDNDMLPFDIDNRFISDKKDELSQLAFNFFSSLESQGSREANNRLNSIQVYNERLLSPSGASGFRISTKIHPFWNIYLNGLAVAIAEENETNRSNSAHSYRFLAEGEGLFDRDRSWRAYKQATLDDSALETSGAIVVQTDISSFYEHIYHHRLENCVKDLFHSGSTVATQVDRLLNQLASGRSFGLPVGGQCSRILAELLMTSIDQLLTQSGVVWHRYVDDFTLIASSQAEAYKAISILSNVLADYGLSLNRSKTTILKANHYRNYVEAQLFSDDENSGRLKEIDLHFDPYSDDPDADYESLRATVEELDVQSLLGLEVHKSQPDSFLITQISRTLRLQSSGTALSLCQTLLNPDNLHSFRASWSTVIRGVASLRANENYEDIHQILDEMIDRISIQSGHLLLPEANCLHYLRALRFNHTASRSNYIYGGVFNETRSDSIKRACLDCTRHWKDRASFNQIRNQWQRHSAEVQRMIWLVSYEFGDEGKHFRRQVKPSLPGLWALGIEDGESITFCTLYLDWAKDNAIS